MYKLFWLIGVCASLVLEFLSLFLAPFLAALSIRQRADRLPRALSWFDTLDATLDGDAGLWPSLPATGWGWRRWLRRTRWLWRNRAYGFSQTVLAARMHSNMAVFVWGDPKIQNRPTGKEGWLYCHIWDRDDHEVTVWCFMAVYRWAILRDGFTIGPWVVTPRCLRIYCGWKIKPEAEAGEVKEPATRMIVFSVNPFMGFAA